MDGLNLGLLLLLVMLVLLGIGIWIPMAVGATAFVCIQFFTARNPLQDIATEFWSTTASWTLAALPLFIWMGEIMFRTRLSEQMFNGLAPWLNWLPGRLMHVNILGCGIFGSVSGSSAATCATIAKSALPELTRRGYDRGLTLGSLATAGTLGILIPPSITMVVYAVTADQSIIRIFLAGFIPGFVLMVLFSGYIVVWSLLNPKKVPAAERFTWAQRWRSLPQLLPVTFLIVLIVVVMVEGWATATEAAAFGVAGCLLLAWFGGSLNWRTFADSLASTTRLTCMIMMILAATSFFKNAMAFTGIPAQLTQWVGTLGLSPFALMAVLTVVYIILGTALDGISMIVLTTATVLPMVQQAGFDLVWFGIFIVLMVEIAEITPPVGFNLFVLQNMTGLDSNYIAKVSLPFFALLVAATAIFTVFPGIVTWLPDVVLSK